MVQRELSECVGKYNDLRERLVAEVSIYIQCSLKLENALYCRERNGEGGM